MTYNNHYDIIVQPIAQGGAVMAQVSIYTIAKELNMTPSMVSRAFRGVRSESEYLSTADSRLTPI